MEKKERDSEITIKETENKTFPIVGIGASAGGLEAIEGFFSHMPSDSNIAFVIIQHLDPKHKSIMGTLLTKYTKMKVLEVKDGMKIEPNCVYLNQPNKNVAIMSQLLHLMELTETYRINLPIDYFFRSLSEDQGEKAICIILSGTGTDGTLGLKAIKGAGGMTMAQEEKQAQYSGMPRSAIDTGLVDFILPVEKMPKELIKYVQHPYIGGPEKISTPEQQFQNYLQKIFLLIRAGTGHDFSNYKQNTTRRRVERRMAVHQISRIADYLRYLQQNTAEVDALFKDLLICVTNFFRDPKAFEVLKEKVIPDLLEKKETDTPVRIWVPGCATGEEAYSLATIVFETMERLKKNFILQIFATDIDPEAIEYARRGVYPESITADVSEERLKRFFVKEENTYTIKKQIRESIVFAVQNLIKDPPFSKLDLVSCRNLLIYMDQVLQKKIVPLFHYTLIDNGVLFLGTSESIGEFVDFFEPVDIKWKIFKRKGISFEKAVEYPTMPISKPPDLNQKFEGKKIVREINISELAEEKILENYAPPCVLINESYDILYFYGPTERYLTHPKGEPSYNILRLAREGLRYRLSTMLNKAVKQKKPIFHEGMQIKRNDEVQTFNLLVEPVVEKTSQQGLIMVFFDDKISSQKIVRKKEKVSEAKEEDQHIAALEQELQSTKEYLQTTIEELETSNEELKSTNEEMQSTNEELQSTNEELETSKEELQSTNEELVTVNSELQNKVDELSRANNDINNLLSSTEIGTIFLDTNLCIKRFTPAMMKFFNLIPSDINRPISDITSNIQYDKLYEDAKEVLKTLIRKEIEIETKEGNWYSMRILPYRTTENMIDGIVVTFVDITKPKMIENELIRANEFSKTVLNSITNDAISIIDVKDYRIIDCNVAFLKDLGLKKQEVIGKTCHEVFHKLNDKCITEDYICPLEDTLRTGKHSVTEHTHYRGDGEKIYLEISASPIKNEKGEAIQVVHVARDITKHKQMEEKMQREIKGLKKQLEKMNQKER